MALLRYITLIDQGNTAIVDLLLKTTANPNKADQDGLTPLHHAIHKENKDIVKLLLNKANPNIADKDGFTPLHYAVLTGKQNLVTLIIEKGADPSIKNKYGHTALDLATEAELPEIIEMLTRYNAEIDKLQLSKESHKRAMPGKELTKFNELLTYWTDKDRNVIKKVTEPVIKYLKLEEDNNSIRSERILPKKANITQVGKFK
jgi:hypothetical protein